MADVLKILVATDCHLGYMEKDEVRKYDSFNTFEEICKTAVELQVDFMLLGGDLFHDNRPSSTTLVKAIEILRRYCLNDMPVQFQVVSDQTINFPNRFGHVNYEDPHYNVGLPVFTIHGNHDDPAGVENISAIDILAASNLVNYFGKVDLGSSGVGKFSLHPILLRKGLTKIALYGLGNIRDERLNRIFQTPQSVQWIRPADQEDCQAKDWFNIFVLHQNRVKSNPKNAINEHFLARFLDLVIWGHEHECLVDPMEVAGMGFHITQPGSSIATSLTDGEAKPKHILLLEIQGDQYRPVKIPLRTVRPFKYKDVILKEEACDTNDQNSVLLHLSGVVQGMIDSVSAETGSSMLPLIRVRVDYTECTTINAQKFGQRFVGKVANPHDVLSFTKSSKKKHAQGDDAKDKELLRPEELNQQNIEALVAENDPKMEIIPLNEFGSALHDFVARDENKAFHNLMDTSLQETQAKLLEDENDDVDPDIIANKVMDHMEKRKNEVRPAQRPAANAGLASSSSTPRSATFPDAGDDDFADTYVAAKATSSRSSRKSTTTTDDGVAKRGRGRGRGRGAGRQSLKQTTLDTSSMQTRPRRSSAAASATSMGDSDDDTGLAVGDEAEELDDPESDAEPAPTPTRSRKRTAASPKRGRGRGSQAAGSKRGRKSSTQARSSVAEDEDEDEEEEAPTPSSRPPVAFRCFLFTSSCLLQARRNWGSLRK